MRKYVLIFILLISKFGYASTSPEGNSSYSALISEGKSREELKAERGLSNMSNTFIPKGLWMTGGTFSYSTHTNDEYNILLFENVDSYGYNFNVSPVFGYSIANNLIVGARFSYNRNLLRIDNSDMMFGDPNDGGIHIMMDNYHLVTHGFSGMAILRQYISLGNNLRFAIFNELQLEGGYSQSKHVYDSPVQGTYATTSNISLNLSPGVVAYATNQLAVEISVGMLGLSHKRIKQIHNQVEMGDVDNRMLNFKINILSINFGVAYYFSPFKR